MFSIIDTLVYIFLGIGVFFNIIAGVGLLRFPDVYTRLHAGTKCTTFGSLFICGSVILLGLRMWYFGTGEGVNLAFHTGVALVAILLTNPTGAHAIARAAHRSGVKPVGAVVDHLDKTFSKKKENKKEEK